MPTHKLNNYLRAHRKRAGLTQREVAYLLGIKARGPVCAIEKQHRMPLLRTALALEVIFGIPAGELFAGMSETITSETRARMEQLASELAPKVGRNAGRNYQAARKCAWLARRCTADTIHGSQDQTGARA